MEAFEDMGCMELVGMEMKQHGMYLARQLSFDDVVYDIFEVYLDRNLIKVYDDSVNLWVEVQRSFTEAEKRQTIDPDAHRTLWLHFWAAHFDFFKYLCISAKIKEAALMAERAVKNGKCVVIGLQTTGEVHNLFETQNEGCDLSNIVSNAQGVLEDLVRKHFPLPSRDGYTHPISESVGGKRKYSFYEADRKCKKTKTDSSYIEVGVFEDELMSQKRKQNFLLEKIGRLGTMLPENWIDELIYELGGPKNVAEISSRKGRAVAKSNGEVIITF
jgi:P-loop containing NTP hydrolase pore-1